MFRFLNIGNYIESVQIEMNLTSFPKLANLRPPYGTNGNTRHERIEHFLGFLVTRKTTDIRS